MWEVIDEVEPVRSSSALVSLTLLDGFLEIGDRIWPERPFGVRAAAFIVVPPFSAPDHARRDTIPLPILDIDVALLDGTSH
jgi:hypothetical protein